MKTLAATDTPAVPITLNSVADTVVQAELFAKETDTKWKEWIATQGKPVPVDLQLYLEKKQKLEGEFFILSQQLGMLRQIMNRHDEQFHAEKNEEANSREVLEAVSSCMKENLNNVREKTLLPTVQAVGNLTKSLNDLKENVGVLREKRSLWSAIQVEQEKITSQQQLALLEEEILTGRISRMESLCRISQENQKAAEAETADLAARVSSLKKKADLLEQLSGVKRFEVVDDLTLEVTLANPPDSSCDLDFVATLLFELDEDKCLVLSQVDTNQDLHLPSSVIKSAIDKNDLPRLMSILKQAWFTDSMLIAEISRLRQSHAIDWKAQERILHLMVGKCKVCWLTVPPSYPLASSGSVTLESILGSAGTVTVESISLPESSSLTEWVNHLEGVLNDQDL